MDYSEPLIELNEWQRKYAEAMRNKKPDLAHIAAMKMIRLAVDLLELTDAP